MSRKHVPGLIPWIALLVLLFMMVTTMERIVDHLSLMELDILDLKMGIEDEEPEFEPNYEPDEVPERMRIAVARLSEVRGT